jgi:predicted DsbA family dithiol-disulfide isomerase
MLTLFHDYTSPGSAVAVRRAHRLAAEGLDIELEGYEAVGIDMVLPATVDVLAELDAVEGDAEAEGLRLRRPRDLPPTGWCHAVARVAEAAGRGTAWRDAAYRAFWSDAEDLADPEVLRRLAGDVGLDGDRVAATLSNRASLAAVRRRTAQLRQEGIGGVPTILAQRTLVPGLLAEDDMRALAAL